MPDAPLDLDAIDWKARSLPDMPAITDLIGKLIAELRQTRAERDMLEKAHAANNRALDTALATLAERDAESAEPNQSARERAIDIVNKVRRVYGADELMSLPEPWEREIATAITAARRQGWQQLAEHVRRVPFIAAEGGRIAFDPAELRRALTPPPEETPQ